MAAAGGLAQARTDATADAGHYQALNGYATTLQNKNPDELVDDARDLVRKSPAVALTGAAVLGFGLARLLKIGLEESQYGTGNRNNDRTGTAG